MGCNCPGWKLAGWEFSWVEIFRMGIVLGGNFPGEIVQVGVFQGGNFLSGNFPGGSYPRSEFSSVGIFRVAILR